MTNTQETLVFVVESDLDYNNDIGVVKNIRSNGKTNKFSILKYSNNRTPETLIVQQAPNGMLYTNGPKQGLMHQKISFKRKTENGSEELQMLVEDQFGQKRVEQHYVLEEIVEDEEQMQILKQTH